MFTAITNFSLTTHSGDYQHWPLTTPLLRDGVPTGTSVPGYVIEGQYAWHDYTLLITSWDCPFEESYDFLLLDSVHEVVARTALGAPYGTFLLLAHWPLDDVSLRLHFYRSECYTLSIRPPAGLLRNRHRLRLHRHWVTPTDPRTQASIRELRTQIEALESKDP